MTDKRQGGPSGGARSDRQLCQQLWERKNGIYLTRTSEHTNQTTADHLRIHQPQEKLPSSPSHGPHICIGYCGHTDTQHPPQRQQLGFGSRTQGLHSPELAGFLGSGQEEVTTVFQPRSHERRGKNVNEDTILNVDSWVLCEPRCCEWSRKTRLACPFNRIVNKVVLRQCMTMSHPCNVSS